MFEWGNGEPKIGCARRQMDKNPNSGSDLTRRIWMYWNSGLDQAPELVRACHESWRRLNPNWDVVLLSDLTLSQYLNSEDFLPRHRYPSIQKYSNHIRLLLLKKHGGLWVDADLICLKPLDTWLPNAGKSGVFMFSSPSKDKSFANWLIYASSSQLSVRNCINRLESEYKNYFDRNDFSVDALARDITHKLQEFLIWSARNQKTTPIQIASFWKSRFVTKFMRITPYYIFHYTVEYLTVRHPQEMHPIIQMTRISAREPLALRIALEKGTVKDLPLPWFPDSLTVSKLNYRMLTSSNSNIWKPLISEAIDGGSERYS